jgi:NTP pyrophosphatase (non-canonical NTP hydrolase)
MSESRWTGKEELQIFMATQSQRSILLEDYVTQVRPTDVMAPLELGPVLLGLFGEVGSIMATAKKYHREREAYAGYRHAVEEEFGDALWYFSAVCRRLEVSLPEVMAGAANGAEYVTSIAANDLVESPISHVATPIEVPELDRSLFELGEASTRLFALHDRTIPAMPTIIQFASRYLRALRAARVTFADVVRKNVEKTRGRFIDPPWELLPTFDSGFPLEEQLPRHFEITIDQRNSGRSFLKMNDVFIGDPLTDNIRDSDGYRFHDVFHFAHAAILHWSPTFRALIKHKRKSKPEVDEAQDGGRAVVVEEGLSAWLFARAKEMNFFEGQERLSFDLLKTIQQFVGGYEVEACPLRLWEIAILKGYDVFRQVKLNRGGIVVGNRERRTLEYKPLRGSER